MLETYDIIYRYKIAATCLAPIRSGGTDTGTEEVLRDMDGIPFIQGASLAGAFAEWIRGSSFRAQHEALFGTQDQAGSLVFSDMRFERTASQSTRPRLRIDGAKGTAADGGKYDLAHIAAGEKTSFTIVWYGTNDSRAQREAVEAMLSAMNGGEILLGGQKTNGFGRLSLEVYGREFHMRNAADRAAWIEDADAGEILTLRKAESACVRFTVTGKLPNVLVKDGAPHIRKKKAVAVNLTQPDGRPVIPGSSVKGAVRARAEMIEEFISGRKDHRQCEAAFGRAASAGNREDNGIAGRVRFSDAVLDESKKHVITRIRINKFTGGVMNGALFSEEPLSSPVKLKIEAPADDPAACGLIVYALRDLGLGLYGLGSGASLGRGRLENAEITAEIPGGKKLTLTFDETRRPSLSDPDRLWETWAAAVKGGNL